MAAFGKSSKIDQIDPTNHISTQHLDTVFLIWTKFGMYILYTIYIFIKIQDECWCSKLNFDKILAQISHFGLANGSCSSDLEKIDMGMLLDSKNKPMTL